MAITQLDDVPITNFDRGCWGNSTNNNYLTFSSFIQINQLSSNNINNVFHFGETIIAEIGNRTFFTPFSFLFKGLNEYSVRKLRKWSRPTIVPKLEQFSLSFIWLMLSAELRVNNRFVWNPRQPKMYCSQFQFPSIFAGTKRGGIQNQRKLNLSVIEKEKP